MKVRVVLQYFRLSVILVLHALFGALLLTQVVRGTGWSWFLVFVPLFVFDGLSFVYYVMYLVAYVLSKLDRGYSSDEGSDLAVVCFPKQKVSLLVLFFYGVGIPVKLAAELLLCFSLRKSVPHYIPGILFSLLFLEMACAFMYYSLKPTFKLIYRR